MKKKFPSQVQDKFTVRFPDGMRDKVFKLAAKNGRSMNAEIVSILDKYITGLEKYDHSIDIAYLETVNTREAVTEQIQKFTLELISTLEKHLDDKKIIITNDEYDKLVLKKNNNKKNLNKKG